MKETRIRKGELFNRLPPEWPEDLLPAIQAQVRQANRKVVVLDDDPTGTQTVHGVTVLTEWSVEQLAQELLDEAPALYLLTNSRSLPPAEAEALNAAIGQQLAEAVKRAGRGFNLVSRSDSTLRGHFPGEVVALVSGIDQSFNAWVLVPYFAEGGRYTIDDMHYVAEGEWLVPTGQTEFARDKAFGYHASNLREWVTEKTGQSTADQPVHALSLELLRQGGPEQVLSWLLNLPQGSICIANAASDRDLEVLVLALRQAEAQGRRYLYRTAASFARIYAGIAPRSLLTRADLHLPGQSTGLVIAGSYVPRTSQQLETLFQQTQIQPVEVNVSRLLEPAERDQEIHRVIQQVNHLLQLGRDTAIYTSRQLISAGQAQDPASANLAIGRTVSDALVEIVRGLDARPRYLLAKGGITSSDIATRGLSIRKAQVLGQILPGVPVWQSGAESRFPGLAYIVFPGNVGEADALAKIVQSLQPDPASH